MAETLQIIAPDPEKHTEQVIELVCKTFGNYGEGVPHATDWVVCPPYYSFPASRIGILGGEVVTHWGVYAYDMCVGTARLRTGGIGAVATHWKHRKKGFMDKTANAAIEGMREAGFDFSILFGIRDFYHRFGYNRAWSERELTLNLADLPEPAKGLTEFVFERRPDLERLFNRYHADITGTAVRPTYGRWNARGKQIAFSWNDRRGKLAGYIAVEDRGAKVDVREAVGDSDAILAAVAFAARKFSCDEIRFLQLPHETPLARRLRRGNVIERVSHQRNGNALARVIHLPRVMSKMAGEFGRRCIVAGLQDYRGRLALTDGRDWVTLQFAAGKVIASPRREKTPHVLRAGNAISQLILGTDDPDEIVEAAGMKTTGDASMLIRALFPNQYPMLNALDHY